MGAREGPRVEEVDGRRTVAVGGLGGLFIAGV